jgi:hypothetical protein
MLKCLRNLLILRGALLLMEEQNKELIDQLNAQIKVYKDRYHKVKMRIFNDAITFLKSVDAENMLELMNSRRPFESTGDTYSNAEIAEGYTDLNKLVRMYIRKANKAAAVKAAQE